MIFIQQDVCFLPPDLGDIKFDDSLYPKTMSFFESLIIITLIIITLQCHILRVILLLFYIFTQRDTTAHFPHLGYFF